jgi:adenylosuccinate synthase
MTAKAIRKALMEKNWFMYPGAYTLVDGQFGSTGKGAIAAALAEAFQGMVHVVTTNAAPNSGHTSYVGDKKIVLKQLPTFSVVERHLQTRSYLTPSRIFINNGAAVDMGILEREVKEFDIMWNDVTIAPNAARIEKEEREDDQVNVVLVAGTGMGTGPAFIKKMQRRKGSGVYGFAGLNWMRDVIFVEVSQGFSLGINSGFYPYVTSRECTVSQALADAGLPPDAARKTIMSLRTFPIRVGNSPEGGWSGPCYDDQEETSFEALGQAAELTTVTKRVRRIFTWSAKQYRDALLANAPDAIFMNFLNYLTPGTVNDWVKDNVYTPYVQLLGKQPDAIIGSYGPKTDDMFIWRADL